MCIKMHGSVSRSWHITPVSYWQEAIFTYTQLRDTFTKLDDFCGGNASQRHHLTFQISTKSHQAFLRYEPLKTGWISSAFLFLFFFLLSNNKGCYKTQMHYPIVLKFCTQQDSVRKHLGTTFGCNNVNGHKVINNYSQKIISICCHVYKVNHYWWKSARKYGNYRTSNLFYLK